MVYVACYMDIFMACGGSLDPSTLSYVAVSCCVQECRHHQMVRCPTAFAISCEWIIGESTSSEGISAEENTVAICGGCLKTKALRWLPLVGDGKSRPAAGVQTCQNGLAGPLVPQQVPGIKSMAPLLCYEKRIPNSPKTPQLSLRFSEV